MTIPSKYSQLPIAFKLLSPLLIAFISLWTAGTMGTLGFGYLAKNNLQKTAYREIEDLAFFIRKNLQQKQELLDLKSRWISENNQVLSAIETENSGTLLQTLLPIQAALNLDLVRIVDTQGNILVSLQGKNFSSVVFEDADVNNAAKAGLDLSGVMNAQNAPISSLISLISVKSSEKLLGGLVVGTSIDQMLLEEIRGDTDLHLVAVLDNQIVASTLPIDIVNLKLSSNFIQIDDQGYLTKIVQLSGFNAATIEIILLKSTTETDQAKKRLWLVVVGFGVLGGTLLTAVTILGFRATKNLGDRIKTMTLATENLAQGDLDSRISVEYADELGTLAKGFNLMAEQLNDRDRQLNQQMLTLENTLKKLHQTQTQMVQNEKMSALGQMVAGIAHEINNPVNFIDANLVYVNEYTHTLLDLIHTYQEHYPNPPESVQAKLDDADLDFVTEDIIKIVESIKVGASRISKIVLSLRSFSRLDESELKMVNLHEGIDNTLMILQHRLKAQPQHSAIEVVKEYGNIPLVECYAGQLNQVFMNLLSNAIDAIEEKQKNQTLSDISEQSYKILIKSEQTQPSLIKITIADNGLGIPDSLRSRIFDPFFTTKPIGKGTGLGLSISYQIIFDKHKGKLWFDSSPNQGTKFIIEIPISQN